MHIKRIPVCTDLFVAKGLIQAAIGATLFIDEIRQLPLDEQVRTRSLDVRVLASTCQHCANAAATFDC
jgi:DNA-binding NtrC family response regulator